MIDRIVGAARGEHDFLRLLPLDHVLVVLSDHGHRPRRGTWNTGTPGLFPRASFTVALGFFLLPRTNFIFTVTVAAVIQFQLFIHFYCDEWGNIFSAGVFFLFSALKLHTFSGWLVGVECLQFISLFICTMLHVSTYER